MTDKPGAGGDNARPGSKDRKRERLSMALRENLKRRKSQARGRSANSTSGAQGAKPGAPPIK